MQGAGAATCWVGSCHIFETSNTKRLCSYSRYLAVNNTREASLREGPEAPVAQSVSARYLYGREGPSSPIAGYATAQLPKPLVRGTWKWLLCGMSVSVCVLVQGVHTVPAVLALYVLCSFIGVFKRVNHSLIKVQTLKYFSVHLPHNLHKHTGQKHR